ncbi:MAG TPA: hypothetical protein VE912_17025 [Bacteroidales bacterium]|nr:hypothetical protein [Bacteroidales bacterium]
MLQLLTTKYNHPLEREYEAWIIRGIEDYFDSIDIKAKIFAVSPTIETDWPSDEVTAFNGKIVGLQFKQAKLGVGKLDFNRLKWTFGSPKGQFNLVLNSQEIYYCLPTFINREIKKQALHHCLFWRPNTNSQKVAWYDNCGKRTLTKFCSLKDVSRWGYFVEEITRCNIGINVTKDFSIKRYLVELRQKISDFENEANIHGLYLIFIAART